MAEKCFLAIDVGAESGRVMAGLWDGSRMRLEEVHRFPNGGVPVGDSLRWQMLRLWGEIEAGLGAAAARYGTGIVSIGADTWGVDFVLLSKSGELLGQPRHYRDARNPRAYERLLELVPREEIFAASGIQFMPINTLCQLLAMRQENPELLEAADRFLMIPDFLHFCLSGVRVTEFTNATTTQFFHPTQKRWSTELLQRLEIPTRMLPEVVPPGAHLGTVMPPVAQRLGLGNVKVTAPATHDTGSAVAAVPGCGRGTLAYISSGTWSLLGVELAQPDLSQRAFEMNLTNEGGVDGAYRLLKNIMGLWIVQQCRRAFAQRGSTLDYEALVAEAERAPAFRSLIDPDDPRFLNPPDMPAAITAFCRDTGQAAPETEGQFIRCALESLALRYATVLDWLKELTQSWIEAVNIVGGGSRNYLLNQFTANACRRLVLAGPTEATAFGNLLVQARTAGQVDSLEEIRRVVRASCEVREFAPEHTETWSEMRERFETVSLRARAVAARL